MKNLKTKKITLAGLVSLTLLANFTLASCKRVTVTDQNGTERKVSVRKLCNEDIDTAIEYITQAYAPYDDAVKLGFDIKKARRTIKWKYIEGSLSHKYLHKDKEYKIVNGIDNWAMAWAVGQVFMNFPVKDKHLKVWGIDNDGFWWNHEYAVFSDLMFEKKGDDYIVSFSNVDGIKRGMKFTGNPEDLKKISYGGRDLYRFIVFPKNYTSQTEISLDGKTYTVPVNYNYAIAKASAQAGFAETKDTVYLSLKNFDFKMSESKDIHEAAEKEFYDVLDKVKACVLNKKSAIIDLRGNPGGYSGYGMELLASVFYGSNEGKVKQFPALAGQYNYGALTLESPVTLKRRYDEIINCDNYDSDAKKKITEKYEYALLGWIRQAYNK